MDYARNALANFKAGFNCSQSVFAAFIDENSKERDIGLKTAAGFGGGIGRQAETCGAVTGGVMVIGLKFSSAVPDPGKKEEIYSIVRKFCQAFKDRNNSVLCRDLLGCDVSTSDGLKTAIKQKLIKTLCPKFVSDAAEILEEIIKQE